MQQLVGGQWVDLAGFVPSWSYPSATPNKFSIGQQSDIGHTTFGAPAGSSQTVRACTTGSGVTTCDPASSITVRDCCTPRTCDDSICGTQSDGCGGTITCSGGCGQKQCKAQHCPAGQTWDSSACQCQASCTGKCGCEAAGGTWVGGRCI